jgi:hypothetical protein
MTLAPTTEMLTVLVNSTDSYEDCWDPFFKLFKQFWPDCPYPIVLNTETKDYGFHGLNIRASRVGTNMDGSPLPWGATVLECLKTINTPYVLWTLEDLFLIAPADTARIESLVKLMAANDITHINLSPYGPARAYSPSRYSELWTIAQNHRYRVSLLNGLWNTRRFAGYIRPRENPWQVELLGSRRAMRIPDSFYCVAEKDRMNPLCWPVPFLSTGITKGKWNEQVPPLFAAHGIQMDFSKRGFYREPHPMVRKLGVAKRVFGGFRF